MRATNSHGAPTRIALLHHTGGGNLGDDAIIDSIVSNIRRRWPEAPIAAISMNPADTERRHGITSYPMRRHTWGLGYKSAASDNTIERSFFHWFRTTRNPVVRLPRAIFGELRFLVFARRRIKTFDLLILGGGGQLTDRSGPWGFPYAIYTWFWLAKSAGVKCIVLNTGAGPLNNQLSKFFITRALVAADYVSFRDAESQALARRIGFTGESHVFPDNVYGLKAGVPALGNFKRRDHPVVGIAPMDFPVDPPFDSKNDKIIYDDLIARLASFSSILAQRAHQLSVFGTDIGVDPQAIQDLRMKLRTEYNIATPPCARVDSLEDVLLAMSALDYVVTCRYHGVVFAHLLNKPVLAIAHHPKVMSLMNALGLSEYCVDIRTFDPRSLADKFESLVKDRDGVKSRMASSLKSCKIRLNSQFDDLWSAESTDSFSMGAL